MIQIRWIVLATPILVLILETTLSWRRAGLYPRKHTPHIFVGGPRYVVINPYTGITSKLKLPVLGQQRHDPTDFASDLRMFPDGRHFVFSNAQWTQAGGLAWGWFQEGKVFVRQLTYGDHYAPCPSWSQKKVALIARHQVAILDLATKKMLIVARIPERFAPYEHDLLKMARPVGWTECVWTRDDRGLLCVWEDPLMAGELSSLWYVGLSPRRKPFKLLDNANHPVVNPRDGRVAYVRWVETPENKRRRDSEAWLGQLLPGRGIRHPRRLPLRVLNNVAWSPNGQELAFLKYNWETLAGSLWVYTLASGRVKRIAGPSDSLGGFVAW